MGAHLGGIAEKRSRPVKAIRTIGVIPLGYLPFILLDTPFVPCVRQRDAQIMDHRFIGREVGEGHALGRSHTQVSCHARDHRHPRRPMLGIPERGIDEGTIDQPQPPVLAGQGLELLAVLPQDPGCVAVTGVDPDIFRHAYALIVEAQPGMTLGMVLAPLFGRAAPAMGALGLVGVIDGPHRGTA